MLLYERHNCRPCAGPQCRCTACKRSGLACIRQAAHLLSCTLLGASIWCRHARMRSPAIWCGSPVSAAPRSSCGRARAKPWSQPQAAIALDARFGRAVAPRSRAGGRPSGSAAGERRLIWRRSGGLHARWNGHQLQGRRSLFWLAAWHGRQRRQIWHWNAVLLTVSRHLRSQKHRKFAMPQLLKCVHSCMLRNITHAYAIEGRLVHHRIGVQHPLAWPANAQGFGCC